MAPNSHPPFPSPIPASLDTHTIQTLFRLRKPHIFAPLGNEAYFAASVATPTHTHCLDWWDARLITVDLPPSSTATAAAAVQGHFRLTCTPGQHFTGRGLLDRFKSLWASWAVEELAGQGAQNSGGKKVWFAGDTGYRTVKEGEEEDNVPCCPVFKEIGQKFGGFDLALIPIG
jgi:N-acyl-phosphatidylethanolamine-hydrolysing phospholipase D